MPSFRPVAGLAIALVAAMALFSAFATSASAQAVPYVAYGINQKAGAVIAANVAGRSCGGDSVVSAEGNWRIAIAATAACAPREGDVVSFTIDGVAAEQTISWTAGGAPTNLAAGIALTPKPRPAGGAFSGSVAPVGVSIVSFTGTTAQLDTAGAAAKAVSISATSAGKMITFVVGAPSFVNNDFIAAFSAGLNGALVIVKT
ncbi:MAG: hypothetical protein EPO16_07765 [Dehalococcoidia bacterium]|nr:MAG: hypothetical protein EPO16_07765 [Dehalococcoidia bacterium]